MKQGSCQKDVEQEFEVLQLLQVRHVFGERKCYMIYYYIDYTTQRDN